MTIEQALAWMQEHSDWLTSQQLTSPDGAAMWLITLMAFYRIAPERHTSLVIEAVVSLKGQFDAEHARASE